MKTREGSKRAAEDGQAAPAEQKACSSGETGDGHVEIDNQVSSEQQTDEDALSGE